MGSVSLATWLKQKRYQARPTRLMRRAEASSCIAVEVFEELQRVAEIGVLPLPAGLPEKNPPPRRIPEEQPLQAEGKFRRDAF